MPEIARIYQDRLEQTGLERRDRFWKELYQFFFSRRIPANASVLELARGYGEFINNIAAGRKFAVDINPDSARHVTPDVTFFNVAATGLQLRGLITPDIFETINWPRLFSVGAAPLKQALLETFRDPRYGWISLEF